MKGSGANAGRVEVLIEVFHFVGLVDEDVVVSVRREEWEILLHAGLTKYSI